jgi:GTP-binding protein
MGMRVVDAGFVRSVTALDQRKAIGLPEVCFVGRSNVGKSSLLNTLTSRKIARLGSTPGATRLINLYNIRCEWEGRRKEVIFSDFPGFGYSKVSRDVYRNWQAMVEGYMKGNGWIRLVLWAFDIRREFDDLDDMLLEWLKENNLSFSLILTKGDKETRARAIQAQQSFERKLASTVFLFSSKNGDGRKELLARIRRSLG